MIEITGYKDKHEYVSEKGVKSVVYLMDCMEGLKQIPEKYIDLSLIDTPYGIGESGDKNASRSKIAKSKDYKAYAGNDIEPPTKEYFDLLLNKSKNSIIWGANHFISRIPYNSPCWIVWDKENGETDFADCELAFTTFKTAVRKFKYRWHGMLQENMKNKEERIHPNQKPVALYEWLIKNYANPNDKILDTHLGSQSSRIAAHKAELNFIGFELDEDYFRQGNERFMEYAKQLSLF